MSNPSNPSTPRRSGPDSDDEFGKSGSDDNADDDKTPFSPLSRMSRGSRSSFACRANSGLPNPDQPEAPHQNRPRPSDEHDPVAPHENKHKEPAFSSLTNLACATQGAQVLFSTDEWFAPAKMFLELDAPVFKDGLFTPFGKWMDGWETRRKRIPGHDWCIIKLGTAGMIAGFEFDTAFFTGNNVPAASVKGCNCPGLRVPDFITGTSGDMGTCATPEDIEKVDKYLMENYEWKELLQVMPLGPGYEETRHNYFRVKVPETFTHLRVNYFPDGGVARFKAFGEVKKAWAMDQPEAKELVDFAASWNGGAALHWSNAHYGVPRNCIAPGRAKKMDEGWETARNPKRPAILIPDPVSGMVNFDYAKDFFILKLGARCRIETIELDTNHFKGNFPESCLVEGIDDAELLDRPVLEQMEYFHQQKHSSNPTTKEGDWRTVLPRTYCKPHEQRFLHLADGHLEDCDPVTHLRVTIFPDGGMSRVRVMGRLALKDCTPVHAGSLESPD